MIDWRALARWPPQGPRRKRLVGILVLAVWAAVAGCVLGAFGGWGAARVLHTPQLDEIEAHLPALATHVYAADGRTIASFARERRIELRSDEIPNHLKLAIVAIEDAHFYRHGGVDPKAIARAALANLRNRLAGIHRVQGGSTLTQQTALNLFLTRDLTLARKIREALLAIDMEKRLSKDQILTIYANMVPLGHGVYGVEAAARLYFDRSARELTLAQSAQLAGMIRSPGNRHDPIGNPEGALTRRNAVLRRMLALDFVDQPTCSAALAEPLGAALHRRRPSLGSYFVETVRQQVSTSMGNDALYTSGLEVHTTMNPELQRAAEEAVREGVVALDMRLGFHPPINVVGGGLTDAADDYKDPSWIGVQLRPGGMARAVVVAVSAGEARLRIGERAATLALARARWTGAASLEDILRPADLVLVRLPHPLPEEDTEAVEVELLQEPEIEAALVALDNRTGAILALVGGFDFHRNKFNCATQAARQCGSAFKPFVYMTAFQQGYTPADSLFDAPFLLADSTGRPGYCPRNYHRVYYGITTLRRALEFSYNATAVKLQHLVNGDTVVETARRFGISTPLRPYASMALGSFEVRLVDLVRAYSGIANLGDLPEPFFISEIRDRNGRTLHRAVPRLERVMPAPVAYLMVRVLRGVVEHGTAKAAASLPAPLAGKTGTTDSNSDAWFVGFSPRLTVGVWVGRRERNDPIGPNMSGPEAALPIWRRFMEQYLEIEPDQDEFEIPAGVVVVPVDWQTGKRANPSCPHIVLEAFLDGTEPTDWCSDSLHTVVDQPWPFQQPSYGPRTGEPMPSPEAVRVADQRLRSE